MKKIVFISLVILLALETGCPGYLARVEKRKNVICLIDYSGTIKPETLDIYAKTVVDNVFMNFGPYDKLTLMPIDEGSKIQAVQLISHDMSTEKFTDDKDNILQAPALEKERLDKYKREQREQDLDTVKREKENRKQFTNFSDILGSLEQAASLLDKNEPVPYSKQFSDWNDNTPEFVSENIIVILSDMIHESSELNFLRTVPDQKMIAKTIADLKANNRLPDFTGSKAFVCGRTGKNNAMIDGIHNFWVSYFKETHAQLVVYDYDCSKGVAHYISQK